MNSKKKVKLKKITIHAISSIAIVISMLMLTKYIDEFIPKFPTIGGGRLFELYMVFGAIFILILPFYWTILSFFLTPFLWWTAGLIKFGFGSFILDYEIPLLSLSILGIKNLMVKIPFIKNKWWELFIVIFLIFIAFIIKWLCHTIAGIIFFHVPLVASMIFNAPFTLTTMGLTMLAIILIFPKLDTLKSKVFNEQNKW